MSNEYPLLEFDESKQAIIEPSMVVQAVDGIPERCVLPIHHTIIESLKKDKRLTHLKDIGTSMGSMPVYTMTHEGEELAVAHPGLSAPFAAGMLEELIALGCRKFIACGSAGSLDSSLPKGMVVIPSAAVRDEGTSYHYLAPGRAISVQMDIVEIIQSVLDSHQVPYRTGKTWTTDAIFRETRQRIAKRQSEGCLTVEMECAAFLAVATFRGVRFGQLLVSADDVSGKEWNPRRTEKSQTVPETLFWLSVEACMKL